MTPLSACNLLLPPYLGESPGQANPPLGSILLWELSTDPSALHALLDVRVVAPWCSLVIKLPNGGSVVDLDRLYDALSALPGVPVALRPGMNPLSTIRHRRPPSIAEVIRYVECRPGHERLASQLRLLATDHGTGLSRRSIRHHFNQSSYFSPRHWEWMIQLAQVKAAPHETVEGLAGRYDMDVRTLRHRVHTCLDVSLDEFSHRVGWEWRVEAALRLDARLRGGGEADRVELTHAFAGRIVPCVPERRC